MSNLHAYADTCELPATSLELSSVTTRMVHFSHRTIAALAATGARRWSGDLSRRSDHLLADMGFERDWDGSVRAVVKEQSR